MTDSRDGDRALAGFLVSVLLAGLICGYGGAWLWSLGNV
jgi:hypothetical protein